MRMLRHTNERRTVMNESEARETSLKQEGNDPADEERREALKKLGKYAVYTAPAMLALLLPNKCRAQCRSGETCP
jgi:hypothetical protein